ncbi:hypothetical protein C1H46_028665 [Malus baccata]|uniref:Protein transport protein SEC23 n=1 Tax=Malus baccata TaxID=106549 RepID=A0A540LHB9_MALBA|nr:hypothetical protein C1H46_028665 [Malus baccata]
MTFPHPHPPHSIAFFTKSPSHLHFDQAIPLHARPPLRPLRCRTCCFVLNHFSIVDYATKVWICPVCFTRNHFPPYYASISDENLPAKLFPQYTTIEYDSSIKKPTSPPIFIFVVDT